MTLKKANPNAQTLDHQEIKIPEDINETSPHTF